ncbi:hypothetical protein N7520_002237 [Penicillium odoratum]|uniref:uncharacterized protein n=1 Tax=Penicillium odoratum TaxID=1167516 RepID=UPI00254904A6|nr:uncharacterized protein N7520_002237 [Penicillium odoratum]KAJ5771708.1 hypothetical protein N7520_002237 [Penicillium odoratum]
MHKTRVFGQSHWIHGVAQVSTKHCRPNTINRDQLQDILHQCEPIMFRENSKAILDLKKCKYLGKIIKDQRTPPWPTAPMSELPPKDLADALVDIYLRTFESRYRVLHIPTFRRDYEALWGTEDRDLEFVLQLKLVMAIGAVIYDENYSLRASSIRWIYEAQTWIAEPDFKARLTTQFIQTNILLLLAREVVGVSGGLVWISVGELLRTAIYIGLHRDPSYLPRISIFDSEIRRRLWNTIIEMALNASLESGGPPLLSFDDFDTHPPGNFDDEDIMAEDPMPKPDGTFTQMSIPLALRKMFEARLGIAKSLNWIGMHSCYEEVLRLDVNLRTSYKLVCRTLDSYHSSRSPSPFKTRTLDFIVRRYLLALHIPFFPASFEDTAYAFSRKIVVDTALQVRCTTNPSSGIMVTRHDNQTPSDDLSRLTICGMGPLRLITLQSCFLIATELRKQLQYEDNLGSIPLRRDLLTVVEDSREWCWKCLVVGETNTKGYLMLALINTQIHALMSRIPDDEFPKLLMRSAEENLAKCLALFEERVGKGDEVQVGLDGINDMVFEGLLGSKGDWNFMVWFMSHCSSFY